MSDIPSDLRYTEEHEYLKAAGDDAVYVVGITDYAQGELGDVVFVELPEAGSSFNRMEVFGTIEAVKAVSDPYDTGWMIKLRVDDDDEVRGLLTSDGYADHVG